MPKLRSGRASNTLPGKPRRVSLHEKVVAIDSISRQDQTVDEVAKEYGVSTSVVNHWYSRRLYLHERWSLVQDAEETSDFEKLEASLYEWYLEASRKEMRVTATMVAEKANLLYSELTDDKDFWPTNRWIKKFKTKYDLADNFQTTSNNAQQWPLKITLRRTNKDQWEAVPSTSEDTETSSSLRYAKTLPRSQNWISAFKKSLDMPQFTGCEPQGVNIQSCHNFINEVYHYYE